jgi:hypothetical protein
MVKTRWMRWTGYVARMGRRGTLIGFVGKPDGRRQLGRIRLRFADNIKMNLGEIVWGGVDCIGLAQDTDRWRALVNAVMNLAVP